MIPCCPRIGRPRRFDHRLICQHQIEVEVWPASAEVHFRDERHCDPVNTQVRFDAAVYNATNAEVTWEVRALDGSPGKGSIDAAGLYLAPPASGLTSGFTEMIVVRPTADPARQAVAYVTVVGRGPEAPPPPTLMLLPWRATVYYRQGAQNEWIDESNKKQVFRAVVRNSASTVDWLVNGGVVLNADPTHLYCYEAPVSGSGEVKTLTARLQATPAVQGHAKVVVANYQWPGIV